MVRAEQIELPGSLPHSRLGLVAVALLVSCSNNKSAETSESTAQKPTPVVPAAEPPPTPAPETAGLSAGPHKIVRTELASRVKKSQAGDTSEWHSMAGFEVSDENLKQLYTSRGSVFVGFQAKLKMAEQDCVVDWKVELIQGDTGRGRSVSKIEGTIPGRAGQGLTLSGVVALSPEEAARIGSASAGYWSLCGDQLPRPSVLDFEIIETTTEQVKFGSSFDLHHTLLKVQSRPGSKAWPKSIRNRGRCYFDLVAEDVDAAGFTLNRDFASYSLASNRPGQAKIRRTNFEGGNERDFAALAVTKRSYLRNLSCAGPWDKASQKLEGIAVEDLAIARYQGEPTIAEHFVRASYSHSATLRNTMGQDCSFRVRYRMLDNQGVPLNRSTLLTQIFHLKKGAKVPYTADKQRLFVWLAQADEVGTLVVDRAAPVGECGRFDPAAAL